MKALAPLVLVAVLVTAAAGSPLCVHGPGYWCSGPKEAAACGATRHCVALWNLDAGLQPATEATEDPQTVCAACLLLAADMAGRGARNGWDDPAQLVTEAKAACGLADLASKTAGDACRLTLAGSNGPDGLLALLAAGLQPSRACVLTRRCPRQQSSESVVTPSKSSVSKVEERPVGTAGIRDVLRLHRGRLSTWQTRHSPSGTCDACCQVVSVIQQQVGNNATQAEIRAILKTKVCPRLPSELTELCNEFADVYLGILLDQLTKDVTPQQLCSLVGFCKSTQQQILGQFRRHPVLQLAQLQSGAARSHIATVECELCEALVSQARQMIRDGHTQKEIEKFVEDSVCKLLPESERQACVQNVEQYGPILFQLLASELDPQIVCQALGACGAAGKARVAPAKALAPKASPQCLVCEFALMEVENMLRKNATQAEIEAALKQVCSYLPDALRPECDSLVQQYTPAIIQMLVNGVYPERVCAAIGICPKKRNSVATTTATPKASPQCLICEFVMRELDQQLSQNATQAEIEAALQQVCSILPQTVRQECVSLVQQYTPIIIQLLVNGISPQRICTAIGLCTAATYKQLPPTYQQQKKIRASPQCLICEFVMRELDQQLSKNATQAEIEAALQQVCSILPQTVRQECVSLVQQYTPIIIQLLVNGISPQRLCTAIGLCTAATFKQLPPTYQKQKKVSASPQCLICEFVMRELDQQLSQNATQAEIEAALQQVCSILPQTVRQECVSLVQQYTPIIIQLLVNGISPERVCTAIGLCSQAHRPLVSRKALKKSSSDSTTACDVCTTVMQYAKALLKENATEQEIVQLVERVCSFLPTTEQAACKSFVEQYGPYVIELLLQDADPKHICQLIGLCTASSSRQPMKHLRVTRLPESRPTTPKGDGVLRFVRPHRRPVRRFPQTANGLVQMFHDAEERAVPLI